jgi:hypothetical protein
MKQLFILSFFVQISIISVAQTQAVTSNGDEVVLYEDGTWKYAKKADAAESKIDTNKIIFTKNSDASFLLKSKITNVGINLNPQKWSFKKSTTNDEAEYSLQFKGKDAYAMFIVERIEIPLENLKAIALENAKAVAPDAKVVSEEYRKVNGNLVYCMQMNGTTQGIKFSYYGYYYSFKNGTVQFVSYTSQNLMREYKKDLEDLLNGLMVVE